MESHAPPPDLVPGVYQRSNGKGKLGRVFVLRLPPFGPIVQQKRNNLSRIADAPWSHEPQPSSAMRPTKLVINKAWLMRSDAERLDV